MKQQNISDRIVCFVGIILIFLLFVSTPVLGDMMPHSTVQEMCFKADLIITGTHLGKGKVSVDKVFYSSDPASKAVKTLDIPSIPKHNRKIEWGDQQPISTNKLVLFLVKDKEGKFWSIHTYPNGSQGLFWYDEKACYGYGQMMNPGPYSLISSTSGNSRRVPKGIDAMRKEIATGLDQRELLVTLKAIKDPADRARKMAAYLLPHTAPKGYANMINLFSEIYQIGPPAVPALVGVLEKAKPTDKLNKVVGTLRYIGRFSPKSLYPAVPALCDLLENPGPTSQYYILGSLTAAADRRAIPHVRPMLQHEDNQVSTQAACALAAMNDQGSFDQIASLLKASPKKEGRRYTRELARSLFELNPQKARPIIREIDSKLPTNRKIISSISHFETKYKTYRKVHNITKKVRRLSSAPPMPVDSIGLFIEPQDRSGRHDRPYHTFCNVYLCTINNMSIPAWMFSRVTFYAEQNGEFFALRRYEGHGSTTSPYRIVKGSVSLPRPPRSGEWRIFAIQEHSEQVYKKFLESHPDKTPKTPLVFAEDQTETRDGMWIKPIVSSSIVVEFADLDEKQMQAAEGIIQSMIDAKQYDLDFKKPIDDPTKQLRKQGESQE